MTILTQNCSQPCAKCICVQLKRPGEVRVFLRQGRRGISNFSFSASKAAVRSLSDLNLGEVYCFPLITLPVAIIQLRDTQCVRNFRQYTTNLFNVLTCLGFVGMSQFLTFKFYQVRPVPLLMTQNAKYTWPLSHDKGTFLRQQRHPIVLSVMITLCTCSTKVFEKTYEIIKININVAYFLMQVTALATSGKLQGHLLGQTSLKPSGPTVNDVISFCLSSITIWW